MFVPFAYRCAYFPRTPVRKSYSGRISATAGADRDLLVGFFIVSSFTPRRQTRADEAHTDAAFEVDNHKQAGD